MRHITALAAGASMRLFAERAPATVEPGDGSAPYAVTMIFDRTAKEKGVLQMTLQDAEVKVWTLKRDEPRAVVEHQDVIVVEGKRWRVSVRTERDDGWVQHVLYEDTGA